MDYPLDMRFKILALAPQIHVTDAKGETVCYVQQKLFKFKEAVNVFSDSTKTKKLCEIRADRIIDFSASYHFFEADGDCFGGVRRRGMRSIWSAHYDIVDESNQIFGAIREENPMAKVFDGLLGEVPLIGIFTGYLFHPRYLLKNNADQQLMRLTKQPAMLEGKYILHRQQPLDPVDELRCLMSFLTMALLERSRG